MADNLVRVSLDQYTEEDRAAARTLSTLIPDALASQAKLKREMQAAQAAKNFADYRRFIRPAMIWNWWVIELAAELQKFYDDYVAGLRPKLILQAPPQHGKSLLIMDFIAWVAGKNPLLKVIFASYSEDLGVRTNMDLQRTYDNPLYAEVFPNTKISTENVVTVTSRWMRNSSVLEYVGYGGSFRNTTVGGQITGQGLDLGFVDDPIKGRAEASSLVTRDKTWNWLTNDFFSRFSDKAAMLMIMTRWHVDDPVGRWIERFPSTKILRYPALAEHDDEHRVKGEPLFPEHKSLEFLMERKKLYTESAWESLYQQAPFVAGGGTLPLEMLKVVPQWNRSKVVTSVRYIDKAGTEDGGAYTACCLMHKLSDKTFVIESVLRGQWSALQREEKIKAVVNADSKLYKSYSVWVEQEPGSGGKESAESTIRNLQGVRVYADKVTGSKEIRAEPFAAQVQGGNISLVAGDWVMNFLDEAESWPMGKYKDQIDAASGAFNKLVGTSSYNSNYKDWAY